MALTIKVPQKAKHLLTKSVANGFSAKLRCMVLISQLNFLTAGIRTRYLHNVNHQWYRCIATVAIKILINPD